MKSLERSLKNVYPFRIGTTSFIYPDLYSENVRRLGPFLDEIELLFFESREKGCLPSEHEIRELGRLKDEHALSYNIHLPTDVDLSSPDPVERDLAAVNLMKVIETTRPLDPVSYTFHLPYNPEKPGGEALWRTYAFKGIRTLLNLGVDPKKLSVETLMYPAEQLKPIMDEFGLSMCLDVGHVILGGGDPGAVYAMFQDRISIIHLHAVHQGSDHMSLDYFDLRMFKKIRSMLNSFTGTVSIEVFSFEDLERSINHMLDVF